MRLPPTIPLAAAALALTLGSAPLRAQAITPELRARVVDSAAALAAANMVFPDVGRRVAARLREALARGAFAADSSPAALAGAIMREGRAVTADLHFSIVSAEQARARGIMPVAGGGGGRPDSAAVRRRSEQERRRNYYFRQLELLPGNVASLTLDQFPIPDSGARETAAALVRVLANADAVILDLRTNPGGAEGLNQLLSSYFFPAGADSTVLYTRYHRVGDSTARIRVLRDLPGPRLPHTPLYILVSGRTGSSAENMAYSLQARKRATVVGEPTAGGANSSRIFGLPGGFVLQLPVARVVNPVTGSNWDGHGVQPDVRVSAAAARDSAHALALRALLARAREQGAEAPPELRAALDILAAGAPTATTTPSAPAPGPQRVVRQQQQPATGPNAADAGRPRRTLGFGLIPHPDGRVTVTDVARGSSAERAGLRDGDLLVELDGTPAASMSPAVMRAAAARGAPVRVIVVRDGRRIAVDVEAHDTAAAAAAAAAPAP